MTAQDAPRRLSDFLRAHRDDIIGDWTARMRALAPARELSQSTLVDHLPRILARIADIVEAPRTGGSTSIGNVPDAHVVDRLAHGFDLDQIVSEYGLLRRSILDLREARVGTTIDIAELRDLDGAFDDLISKSIVRYARAREKLLRALDRVSEAALGSDDLNGFLGDLLRAAKDGTEAVDTCAVFLREGEVLRLRAAVGLEEALPRGYSQRIGEGFSGHVAAARQPVLLPEGHASPIVISPVLREQRVRALYGVPLMHDGKAIGVAQIGSVSASEFSEEDKLLFRTVVSRATSGVVRAQILADLRRTEAAQRFLSEATVQLAESLDYEVTLAKIAHLAVPVIADWCLVDLLEGTTLRRVSVAHADPAKEALGFDLDRRDPVDLEAATGIPNVLRTGVPEWQPEIADAALIAAATDEDHFRLLRDLGLKSYVIVPILIHERVLGTITLVTAESRRRYSEFDLRLAEDLGRRVGMALENAGLYREARAAVAIRDRVLAVVSHDLRNQLGIVMTAAQLLSRRFAEIDTAQFQDISKTFDRMMRSVDGTQHLLGDLLDMTSIQAGQLSFEHRPHALKPILIEACDSHESTARAKDIAFVPRFEHIDVNVICDRDRVLQALANLLGNAIKFCSAGDTITLAADVAPGEAIVSVSDTGPGIPSNELDAIFDAYRTGERRAATGTGLGLYITKRIVERHGGRVWVKSDVGVGSTFYFTLPLSGQE